MAPQAVILFLISALGLTACKPGSNAERTVASSTEITNAKTFQVKGLVISVTPKEKSIEIKHEAIPGYMPSMTMPFDVKDSKELSGLKPGDAVEFRMIVTDTDGWIDQVKKTSAKLMIPTNTSASSVRPLRDVEPLETGDPLPDYSFTNQFSKKILISQFKGQALAITFLFTRCPFPTFCPLLANRFAEAQAKLESMNNFTNWHLLTISFDPEFDTPAVLKAYAERYKYDPAHSSFAIGDLAEVMTFGDQVGLNFRRDDSGSINHNLRTLVVGADQKLRKIFVGNDWTTEQLVDEIVSAGNTSSADSE